MSATAEGISWKTKFAKGEVWTAKGINFTVVQINRRGLTLRVKKLPFNCCSKGNFGDGHTCDKQPPL